MARRVAQSVLGRLLCALAVIAGCRAGEAVAQRAGENAVAAADDAFGTRVGNESVGLYGAFNARGFSPSQAGNVRIEGLYFDQQAPPTSRTTRGSSVRVGISAQSYAFPAPTGIADYNLRIPGDKQIVSTVLTLGFYTTRIAEIDAQLPIVAEKFSLGLSAGLAHYDNDFASENNEWSFGTVARLRPSDNAEVIGFFNILDDCHFRQQPTLFPGGAYLPPRHARHTFFGQSWTRNACRDSAGGALGRLALPGDWTLRAGAFRSGSVQQFYSDLLRNVQPDGTGQHSIIAQPQYSFISYSGELRASKVIPEGQRRHTFDFALRARDVRRRFGGADVHDFGIGRVGVREELAKPVFTLGPRTDDHTQQATVGAAYNGLWAGMGAFGMGVQKSFYRRDIAVPGAPLVAARDQPWLYNVSGNAFLGPDVAVYASYTRGLEESGSAPPSAVNRAEGMPASITSQIDAGIRYTIAPGLRLIAGVFEVKKPYFNLNAANIYGPLGDVRHRGVELSLTGRIFTDGLTAVAGVVLLQPRVSGELVERGVIGPVPVGPLPRNVQISLQYQPPAWGGFALDGQITNSSAQMMRSDNTFKIPGFTSLTLGARYTFNIADVPTSLRFQVQNVTNAYGWLVNNSGNVFPRAPRRVLMSATADF